jgi:hypothetical protein
MNSKQALKRLLLLFLTTLLILVYTIYNSDSLLLFQPAYLSRPLDDFSTYPLVDQEIFRQLQRLQSESNCSSQKLLVFDYDMKIHNAGFGSQLHQLVIQLHNAFEANRTLVFFNSKLNNDLFKPRAMTHCHFDLERRDS